MFGALVVALTASPRPTLGQTPAPPVRSTSGSNVQIGFEERFRTEHWNDIVDHTSAAADARRQYRFRTRVWTKVSFGSRWSFFVGLNNESKAQTEPSLPLTLDETIIENLYVDLRPTEALAIRVGRQNLARGDGFILSDGTTGDGSRSFYTNGVTLAWTPRPQARLELIALSDPHRDIYLPVIRDKKKSLTEWNERLLGAYYTDTRAAGTDVQIYCLWKDERGDSRPPGHPQLQPNRAVNTLGTRVARGVGGAWTVTGEFAGQWGTQAPSTSIRAWGGYLNVRRAFARAWKPTLLVGYTAMSGDDPATAKSERWDPVLSRWPKWSELYIYSLGPEVGASYWTNTALWQAEATFVPHRSLSVRGTYYYLTAFHPFAGSPDTFASGTSRGHLVQARADLLLSPTLKGHVLYEYLVPGTFYSHTASGYFFRAELVWALQKTWTLGG